MKNYLLRIAYDGSRFEGFQQQEGRRTVSGVLRQAVEDLVGRKTRLVAAGRTDAGVHAEDQAVNFLTTTGISARGFRYHLQKLLPDDLICLTSSEVPLHFHARFACRRKTYRYVVSLDSPMMPIHRFYKANCPFPLDLARMADCLDLFTGLHDFSSFSKFNPLRQPVRSLDEFTMDLKGSDLIFRLTAESFLHNQVRMLVGAMIQIGRGQLDRERVVQSLAGEGEQIPVLTYPACGLTLESLELGEASRHIVKFM